MVSILNQSSSIRGPYLIDFVIHGRWLRLTKVQAIPDDLGLCSFVTYNKKQQPELLAFSFMCWCYIKCKSVGL